MRRLWDYAWASPNSLIGLVLGAALILGGARMARVAGALEIAGGALGGLLGRSRIALPKALTMGINFRLLDNTNDQSGYEFRHLSAGANLEWRPGGAQWLGILGDYTWSSYKSDIEFLLPPFFTTAVSAYRDNAQIFRNEA